MASGSPGRACRISCCRSGSRARRTSPECASGAAGRVSSTSSWPNGAGAAHPLAARDPETGAAFSPEELRDQVATMIVAGHETTAVALFWSLQLLALAPDAQDRVAREAAATPIEDASAP